MKRLSLGAILLAVTAQAQTNDLNVGGFVDGQFNYDSRKAQRDGFVVNDGELQVSMKKGGTEGAFELPFRSNADNSATSTAGNGFSVGTGKMQAFVAHQYGNGARWKLGQWDSLFGYEANDTNRIMFSRQGLLKGNVNPYTHTGALMGYDFAPIGFNAFVANPDDQGALRGRKYAWGAQLTANPENFRMALGAKSGDGVGRPDMHYQAIVGGTFGMMMADIEFDYKKPGDVYDFGWAAGGQVGFMMDEWSFGTRFDYLHKVTTTTYLSGLTTLTTNDVKNYQWTIGPQYQMSKNLKIKVDYSLLNTKVRGSGKSTHGGALAAVFTM